MNAVNATAPPVSAGRTADDLLTDLLLQNQLSTTESSSDAHIYQTPRQQQQQQQQQGQVYIPHITINTQSINSNTHLKF